MVVKLHWLVRSRSQRIVWLLEELGIEYDVVKYARDKRNLAEPALEKVHPLGKSPVVELDDGTVVAESALIIQELIRRYAPKSELAPKTAKEEFDVQYGLYHAEGSLQPLLLLLLMSHGVLRKNKAIGDLGSQLADGMDQAYGLPNLAKNLDFLEATLAKNSTPDAPWGYFAGNHLTGADILYSFPIENAAMFNAVNDEQHPHIVKWLDHIHSRPAYIRAEKRVPYNSKL